MKATVDRVVIARARAGTARVSGVRVSDAGKAKASFFHPSLVDYWNFKAKSNSDPDRDMIKGVKGGILTAHNFGWSLNSGYGLYGTDFKTQWNNTHSSYGYIVDSVTAKANKVGSGWFVVAYYRWKSFADSFKGRVTGLPQGYSLYIGYGSHLFKLTDTDGEFTVNKSDIPGFAPPTEIAIIDGGFKVMLDSLVEKEVPADLTIELLPEYPAAMVFDGVDDYLEFDQTGYKIGTIICRHTPLKVVNWSFVYGIRDERKFIGYENTTDRISHNFDRMNKLGDYVIFRSNIPTPANSFATIGCMNRGSLSNFLGMALYDIALYEDSLTDTEIEKEIIKMQSL